MKKLIFVLFLGLLHFCGAANGQTISQRDAVDLAEKFVFEHGFTSASPDQIKPPLDFESVEHAETWREMLKRRHNTLQPKAIGAKAGRKASKVGWSVSFDYSKWVNSDAHLCRVVTMDNDGSNIRIEHLDGLRTYFAGFK